MGRLDAKPDAHTRRPSTWLALAVGLGLLCGPIGCAAPGPRSPGADDSTLALAAPHNLRPCCAFGHQLGLSLGGIPLPIRLDNVVDLSDLGHHRYDGGLVSAPSWRT